jgi:hypothetical protein
MLASSDGLADCIGHKSEGWHPPSKSGLFAGFLRDAVTWSFRQHHDRRWINGDRETREKSSRAV